MYLPPTPSPQTNKQKHLKLRMLNWIYCSSIASILPSSVCLYSVCINLPSPGSRTTYCLKKWVHVTVVSILQQEEWSMYWACVKSLGFSGCADYIQHGENMDVTVQQSATWDSDKPIYQQEKSYWRNDKYCRKERLCATFQQHNFLVGGEDPYLS